MCVSHTLRSNVGMHETSGESACTQETRVMKTIVVYWNLIDVAVCFVALLEMNKLF